ncbi:cyclase protein [Meredithblackwellia eburnea MCA 4105]
MVFDTPLFSELPTTGDGPIRNAWGVFGKDDNLGTLNHLDKSTVQAAASEIKTGHRIRMSLPMNFLHQTAVGRLAFSKTFIHKAPRDCNDDEWTFNSQASSQWDGPRHYGYRQKYYNGRTMEDFETSPEPNGIHNFADGICGRGVLVDWFSWSRSKGRLVNFHAEDNDLSVYNIPLEDIKNTLNAQRTIIRPGDILCLRTGWTQQYRDMSKDELINYHARPRPPTVGALVTEHLLEWLWNNKFSAVCSDNKSFETWTPNGPQLPFHERALCAWGMPIGELFDLDSVAQHCQQTKRFTFFFSSVVVNVPGAVASPANTIAIF